MKREPAALLGFIAAALGLGTSLNIHGLSAGQVSLIVAAITAVFGAVMAWKTRPVAPAVFTTAVSAIAALVAGYGYHVSPGVVGAVNAVVLSVLTLVTRAQVVPTGPTPAAVHRDM
jgi:hydrogenase/urease accessory protein HupE